MIRRFALILLFVGLTVALASSGWAQVGGMEGGAEPEAGGKLYRENCANCHGPTGKGDGDDAAKLPAKPTNFTDCAKMKRISDRRIEEAIRRGAGPKMANGETAMPPADIKGNEEILALIHYVRHFCEKNKRHSPMPGY